MIDRERAQKLLAERRARREQEERAHLGLEVAERLRAWMYPKQRAFFTSPAKRKASRKTRRAGATTGGNRELLARAITVPRFRATYIGETRLEARSRAWESDTQGGLVDLLREHGRLMPGAGVDVFELGRIEFEVRQQELAINTSTGGRIDLFGADDERSLNKQRGNAKHLYWLDEAQAFRWLDRFYRAVASPALVDFNGEFWMTGTPDRDCSGMFFEATRDDGEPPLAGWEVHEFAAVDNPYFGDTPEERWAKTGERAAAENGWSVDDPDFQREWCARWVKSDANFVYAVNSVVPESRLYYADHRAGDDGFPDVKTAILDLPGMLDDPPRDYFFALAADLGTRDDFAFVLDAWSLRDPVLYEVSAWKKPGLDYDEMFERIVWIRKIVHIGLVIADAGGGGKGAVKGWSKKWVERYNLPIVEAAKTGKDVAIKLWNNDIRRGLYKFRRGSPLMVEAKVHRWASKRSATGRVIEDPTTPNHCLDAGLYAHRESYHHRFREEELQPEPGSAEWAQREEQQLEDDVIDGSSDLYRW